MGTNDGYNGWSNYETWCVESWLSNDQGAYECIREQAQLAWDEHESETDVETRVDNAVRQLWHSIEALVDGMRPELESSLFDDIISTALGRVDWREIANAWLNDELGPEIAEAQVAQLEAEAAANSDEEVKP